MGLLQLLRKGQMLIIPVPWLLELLVTMIPSTDVSVEDSGRDSQSLVAATPYPPSVTTIQRENMAATLHHGSAMPKRGVVEQDLKVAAAASYICATGTAQEVEIAAPIDQELGAPRVKREEAVGAAIANATTEVDPTAANEDIAAARQGKKDATATCTSTNPAAFSFLPRATVSASENKNHVAPIGVEDRHFITTYMEKEDAAAAAFMKKENAAAAAFMKKENAAAAAFMKKENAAATAIMDKENAAVAALKMKDQNTEIVPDDEPTLDGVREEENAAVVAAKVLNTAAKNTTTVTNAPIYGLLQKGFALDASKTISNLTTHDNIIASPLDSDVDGGTVGPPKYILALPSKVKVIGKVGKLTSISCMMARGKVNMQATKNALDNYSMDVDDDLMNPNSSHDAPIIETLVIPTMMGLIEVIVNLTIMLK
ncbi:hypothetical protein ACH5RR_015665 [Cinchona calisaya]|uniref:Uncharacterized protein n=1 Tax=Cinchona calisaya TaxID=153742 RepID=A0ABD2ZTT7_9GENT